MKKVKIKKGKIMKYVGKNGINLVKVVGKISPEHWEVAHWLHRKKRFSWLPYVVHEKELQEA